MLAFSVIPNNYRAFAGLGADVLRDNEKLRIRSTLQVARDKNNEEAVAELFKTGTAPLQECIPSGKTLAQSRPGNEDLAGMLVRLQVEREAGRGDAKYINITNLVVKGNCCCRLSTP